jgi:hypothetical protein
MPWRRLARRSRRRGHLDAPQTSAILELAQKARARRNTIIPGDPFTLLPFVKLRVPTIIAGLAIIAFFVIVYCSRNVKNKVDALTVEKDIETHLPIGSSKAEVIVFLDQRKIGHTWLQEAETSPEGKTVIPNRHTEIGMIPDVRRDGLILKTDVTIEIQFRFDDADSKLVGYSVREIYTGP